MREYWATFAAFLLVLFVGNVVYKAMFEESDRPGRQGRHLWICADVVQMNPDRVPPPVRRACYSPDAPTSIRY